MPVIDKYLEALCEEFGHTIWFHPKTRTGGDPAGARVSFAAEGIGPFDAFVEELSAREVEIQLRMGVRATHLIFCPVLTETDDGIAPKADDEVSVATPTELAATRYRLVQVRNVLFSGGTKTAGRHLEILAEKVP